MTKCPNLCEAAVGILPTCKVRQSKLKLPFLPQIPLGNFTCMGIIENGDCPQGYTTIPPFAKGIPKLSTPK